MKGKETGKENVHTWLNFDISQETFEINKQIAKISPEEANWTHEPNYSIKKNTHPSFSGLFDREVFHSVRAAASSGDLHYGRKKVPDPFCLPRKY